MERFTFKAFNVCFEISCVLTSLFSYLYLDGTNMLDGFDIIKTHSCAYRWLIVSQVTCCCITACIELSTDEDDSSILDGVVRSDGWRIYVYWVEIMLINNLKINSESQMCAGSGQTLVWWWFSMLKSSEHFVDCLKLTRKALKSAMCRVHWWRHHGMQALQTW